MIDPGAAALAALRAATDPTKTAEMAAYHRAFARREALRRL
jgi:hypothetical protein